MKKRIIAIAACLLLAQLTIAQQIDTTFSNRKSNNKGRSNVDKKYSDSSSKYYPYGDSSADKNQRSKKIIRRDKVDSVNPKH